MRRSCRCRVSARGGGPRSLLKCTIRAHSRNAALTRIGSSSIERQRESQRLFAPVIRRPDAQFPAVGTNDCVSTVRASTFLDVTKFTEINWARASETRRRGRERHHGGQHICAPEYSRLIAGKLRINRKRRAPNARQGHPWSGPRSWRGRRPCAQLSCSLLDKQDYGAGTPTQNRAYLAVVGSRLP